MNDYGITKPSSFILQRDTNGDESLPETGKAKSIAGFESCSCNEPSSFFGMNRIRVTYTWFDEAFEDADDLGIQFTSIGVTTNEAGAVQSVLKWASRLQDRVDYLIILNEFREPRSKFEYWHDEPAAARFTKAFSPHFMTLGARIPELQAELRNQSTTLQKVIEEDVDTDFLRGSRNSLRIIR